MDPEWGACCNCDKYANCVFNNGTAVREFSQDMLQKYYVHANEVIRKSGKYNYEYCKFPVPSPWDLDRFEYLLQDYEDNQIIVFLRYGWPIDSKDCNFNVKQAPNQKGARENAAEVQSYLKRELRSKSMIGPFAKNPFGKKSRISPIDAIPKKDSDDKRIILNLSHPDGLSVNSSLNKNCYLGKRIVLKYPTVDDLVHLIHQKGVGAALMKTDLKRYYRQICFDPGSIHLVGFRVGNEIYWDITLSMGLTIACYIAQRISSAILYIYHCRGYVGLNYIDDLAAVEVWSRAYLAFEALVGLLDELKIWESEHKRCPPDVCMSFLGVLVDSLQMRLSLTEARLAEIKSEARIWLTKETTSKKDLQRLVGKLNFASSTVRAGRLFFSRILDFMKSTPKHGVKGLTGDLKLDIRWWALFLDEFNGISCIQSEIWSEPDAVISTDSTLTGVGGFCDGEYFHADIPAEIRNQKGVHINELECAAVMVALKIWSNRLQGLSILMFCDNESTVSVVNSGRARNSFTQSCLREIVFLAAKNSFQVRVQFKPGVDNRISDFLSRWNRGPQFKHKFFEEVALNYDVNRIKQVLVAPYHFAFVHDW